MHYVNIHLKCLCMRGEWQWWGWRGSLCFILMSRLITGERTKPVALFYVITELLPQLVPGKVETRGWKSTHQSACCWSVWNWNEPAAEKHHEDIKKSPWERTNVCLYPADEELAAVPLLFVCRLGRAAECICNSCLWCRMYWKDQINQLVLHLKT